MSKPYEPQLLEFLRGNLGKRSLAPLTGTDFRALLAAGALMECYAGDRHPTYLIAFAHVEQRMQRKCWYFAFHAIAKSMEWESRMEVWMAAGLPTEPLEHMPLCEMEPARRSQVHAAADETRELLAKRAEQNAEWNIPLAQ